MSFHEVRFPTDISFGAVGGPERQVDIVKLANGYEERNARWAHSLRSYDAGLGVRSMKDLEEVVAFFEARMGQLYGFRWRDPVDFRSCAFGKDVSAEDQLIMMGDGERREFTLTKRYASGGHEYLRPIHKPVAGSVRMAIAGFELVEERDFTLDQSRGIVRFDKAPPRGSEVTAGFQFDVPVRFDVARLDVNLSSFEAGEVPHIPVVELKQ